MCFNISFLPSERQRFDYFSPPLSILPFFFCLPILLFKRPQLHSFSGKALILFTGEKRLLKDSQYEGMKGEGFWISLAISSLQVGKAIFQNGVFRFPSYR